MSDEKAPRITDPRITDPRIKTLKNGPYVVTGNIPLSEMIIEPCGGGYVYREGRTFPRREKYLLCRCGRSANMPFCDGMHAKEYFSGEERADRKPYMEQAKTYEGPGVTMTDCECLCAVARFCHTDHGNTWELVENSGDPDARQLAIKTAEECPAGRLVAWNSETGEAYEPYFEPSIVILQDPERDCSGPLWVRGGIQIEGEDGFEYEVRNRVTLCRCGYSNIKPYCDANHMMFEFNDGQIVAANDQKIEP